MDPRGRKRPGLLRLRHEQQFGLVPGHVRLVLHDGVELLLTTTTIATPLDESENTQ